MGQIVCMNCGQVIREDSSFEGVSHGQCDPPCKEAQAWLKQVARELREIDRRRKDK